jgi:hypothetical protein
MDALKTAFKWLIFVLLLPFFSMTAGPTSVSRADECVPSNSAWYGHAFDGTTLCRWRRTWYGPNDIWRPLTPYYVPRPADPCKYGGHGGKYGGHGHWGGANGCGEMIEDGYFSEEEFAYEDETPVEYGYSEAPGMQVGMERLGEIPNDMGIAGGVQTAPPQAGR